MSSARNGRQSNSATIEPADASASTVRFSAHQLKVIDTCLRPTGFDFRTFAPGPIAETEWDALKLLHLDLTLPTADPSMTSTTSRLSTIIYAAAQCVEESNGSDRDEGFWKKVKDILADDETFREGLVSDFMKLDNILYRYYSAWVSFKDRNPGMSRRLIQQPFTASAESRAIHQLHRAMAGYRACQKEIDLPYTEGYDKGKRDAERIHKTKLHEMKAQRLKEEADMFALNRTTMDRNRQVAQENTRIIKECEELAAEISELRKLNKELNDLYEASQKQMAADRLERSTGELHYTFASQGQTDHEVVDLTI
ncbi:hypothetical protein CORC01_08361 [Colletotrichum orchidophilum]|uniref:Uncharacterized protein n=1 Tax=Colletotrichum orchidophilum TaxID=1209926 RepID=A0A1G4B4E0_9PEZI|nr:uncharacterized protein CORC01_08361 [Colletotrichum orchidophilum]OHE96289.1 hypothetical protein CORC01_08361 [Colletotrichum orchidophilum]